MGALDMIRGRKNNQVVHDLGVTDDHHDNKVDPEMPSTPETDSRLSLEAANEKSIEQNPDQITDDAQIGVKKAEATALVWSKKAVVLTYVWIWVCFFMLSLQQSVGGNVILNAYSSFVSAPQVSTANILYSIIAGVIKLPIAKTLNIWGRAEGYIVFVGVYVLGMIILAACNSPDSYAAGYVIYYIGYEAIYLILQIFVADTSGLRNRAFAFAFSNTPFIATAFVGPLAAQSFLDHSTWRWAYGVFTIVQPVVLLPLAFVFKFYQKKAERLGLFKRQPSGRTVPQSIIHYFHEFDIVGAFLLMASWVLLLLPFSLQQNGVSQYKGAAFIAMLVVGFCMFFVFAAWERWGARTHFIRYDLLKQRTVLGACFMSAITFFSFYCWDLNLQNFCIVVHDLSIAMSGYVLSIYNVGSCFWGVVFGIYVRLTKHFKYACLFFGLPLLILGAGLMIHFRGAGDSSDIGYLVMCQIFIAFGGGTLVIGSDMAVMAAADRDGVPMMLSLLGLFNALGGAAGYAVSTAINNNVFQNYLRAHLPDDMKSQTNALFIGGYTAQIEYAMGTPTRDAINGAWSRSQYFGAIAATAVLVLAIPCIAVWKNYHIDKRQNKGTVI